MRAEGSVLDDNEDDGGVYLAKGFVQAQAGYKS
jgi:hypothetical protein